MNKTIMQFQFINGAIIEKTYETEAVRKRRDATDKKFLNWFARITLLITYVLPYQSTDGFATHFGYPFPFLTFSRHQYIPHYLCQSL